MTLQSTPAYARILSHPEVTLRNAQRAMFGSRSGATRYGDFVVAPTATTRQFSVGAGRAHILGVENSQQGGYVAWNDASENLLVGAPAASPVIDTVLLRIYDEQYGTLPSGTSRAQWDIVRGTPNASPVALPDSAFLAAGAQYVPGAWWRLCDIRTNPGDTTIPANQIYPTNTFSRSAGHTLGLSVASTTGFGGFPTDAVLGDRFFALDLKRTYEYDGSAWRVAGGIIAYGNRSSNSSTTTTETSVLRIDNISMAANRSYRIATNPIFLVSSVANDIVAARIRINTAGTAVIGSTPICQLQDKTDSSQPTSDTVEVIYRTTAAVTASILLTVGRSSGTGNASFLGGVDLWVEDMGPSLADTGVDL